jgi:hypothetical protein
MQYSFVAAVIFAAVSIHANPIILPTSQSDKHIGTRGIPDEHMCAANVGTTTWMPLADFDMARSSFCEQATDREIPLGESFSQVVGTWDLAAGKKKSEYVLGKLLYSDGCLLVLIRPDNVNRKNHEREWTLERSRRRRWTKLPGPVARMHGFYGCIRPRI